jgi:hypothetical protein
MSIGNLAFGISSFALVRRHIGSSSRDLVLVCWKLENELFVMETANLIFQCVVGEGSQRHAFNRVDFMEKTEQPCTRFL